MLQPRSKFRVCLAWSVLLGVLPIGATAADEASSTNQYGTLGVGQVVSAEAMGAGKLTLQVRGSLYQQGKGFPGAPDKNAMVLTGTAAVAGGLSPYADAFLALSGYNVSGSADSGGLTPNGAGLGTVALGFQASMPFSQAIPVRVGLQAAALAGTAGSQVNRNQADGFNYFETRKGTDFMARLTQSILFSGAVSSLKLHFNEGVATSLESGKYAILMQGAGLEVSLQPNFVAGLEFNSRSFFRESQVSDPMWVTPSLAFRNQRGVNAQLGADVSLSRTRVESATRALEPWRVFAGLSVSMDVLEGKRRDDRARRDSLEKLELEKQARLSRERADSLARKAREDSLALAGGRRQADSLAQKAREDSLLLAEARRKLEEEKANRTTWEKDFLRTGVLNLEALYFETGKAVISINSKPYLNLVGKVLSKYPKLQMEIGGHTDNTGRLESNMRLSQDRADAVRMYLASVVSELYGRLSAKGYGPNDPKESNRTADGRQINRRVEIKVLNTEVLREYE